jgi:hypothetical protein
MLHFNLCLYSSRVASLAYSTCKAGPLLMTGTINPPTRVRGSLPPPRVAVPVRDRGGRGGDREGGGDAEGGGGPGGGGGGGGGVGGGGGWPGGGGGAEQEGWVASYRPPRRGLVGGGGLAFDLNFCCICSDFYFCQ